MRVVFIGPPGSGKGTQSGRLRAELGLPHLSTGELLREAQASGNEIGLQVSDYLSEGRLVPDDLVIAIVEQRLHEVSVQGCLFDGFPRTVVQAERLDSLLAESGMPLDVVVELQLDESELVCRLSSRGRDDDAPDTVKRRLSDFHKQTAPLLEYYRRRGLLKTISASGTPDEVFARIMGQIESCNRR